jgi:hypothetical protein
VKLVISDAHEGLKPAVTKVLSWPNSARKTGGVDAVRTDGRPRHTSKARLK